MQRNRLRRHRSPVRRVVPLVLVSILLTISPVLTTSALALDSITGILAAGETLSTGAEATLTDPTATSVTVPVAGVVTIAEGPATQTAPSGREFFGQEIDITAPVALTILEPIKMVFRFDTSVVPAGASASEIRMFRNGTELPACTGAATTASPDPCTASISIHATTGDLEIVALTSAASKWNAGKVKASDGGGSMNASPGSVVASSTDNDVTFAFTAATGGMKGQLQMTVPPGWSAPQSTDPTASGHVSIATETCAAAPDTKLASISTMVVTVDMECPYNSSFSISYANASAPTSFGSHEFTTKTRLDGGTLTAIADQPKVSTEAGALARFAVSALKTVTAGTASSATVTAKDALGNTIDTYAGTATVSHNLDASARGCGEGGASSCNPSVNLGSFTSGSATVTTTAYRTQTGRKFTITDGSIASDSGSFDVKPSDASNIALVAPASATAGTPFSATTTTYDTYGNIATGYRGTVSFSSSDAHANLPDDHVFLANDAGTRTFSITLDTVGHQTLTAKDTAAALSASDSVAVADTTVPGVTISSVDPSLVTAGQSATIIWSATERGTFAVRVGGTSCSDGTLIATGSYTSGGETTSVAASELAEGTNVVRVCVTDSGANTGSATATVKKDSVAPDTVITSGPSGTINTATVTFGFSSRDTTAALSCRMTASDGSVVSASSECTSGTKTYDIAGLGDGTYTFEATATDAAGNADPTPATSSFTIDRSTPQIDRIVAELEAGGTVSTGTQATASDVVVTSVRVPVAGSVTIEETAITQSEPQGWNLLAQQVNITAPEATSFEDPIRLVFQVSLTTLPEGYDADDVSIFRNGTIVSRCSAPASDPCFSAVVGVDSLELTVLTTRASAWTFGVAEPTTEPTTGPTSEPTTEPTIDPAPVVSDPDSSQREPLPVESNPVSTSPRPSPTPTDAEAPEVLWKQRGLFISPNGDGRRDDMRLSATFSEPVLWDLSLQPSDTSSQQTSEQPVSASGSGTELVTRWSDLTAGRDLPDGIYVWTLRGEDLAGNRVGAVSGNVVVDRTAPVISSPEIAPAVLPRKEKATIAFTISEAARVRVKIVANGSVVRKFRRQTAEDAGTMVQRWGGRGQDGRFVKPGRYRLVIRAVDRAGVTTVHRGIHIYVVK